MYTEESFEPGQEIPVTEREQRVTENRRGTKFQPKATAEIDWSESNWKETKPLQRELERPEEFPVDAMGVLKEPVKRAWEVIQAPLGICAFSFLAAANLAVQAHGNLKIDGRISPLSEFFVTISLSSERKSATDREALQPHREWQEQQQERYQEGKKRYEKDKRIYDSSSKQIIDSKKSDKEKSADIDRLTEPEAPLNPFLLAREPTYQGLTRLLAEGLPTIGLFNDDGGQFLGGHAMSKDHQLETAAGLCGIYDSGSFDRIRSGDGPSCHYGKRVALHLMLQPDVSSLLLANPLLKDQGLLSRCLVIRPEPINPKRYASVDLSQEHCIQNYRRLIRDLLSMDLPVKNGTRNVLQPRAIELAADAKEQYIRFHDHIQSQLGDGNRLENIRGFAGKAHDHAARIALTFALLENPHCTNISRFDFQKGEAIVLHCLTELLRLIDVKATDEKLLKADTLLCWLWKRNKSNISLVEIYKEGPNFVRSVEPARKLMNVLYDHGYVKPSSVPVEYAGKNRAESFEIRRGD